MSAPFHQDSTCPNPLAAAAKVNCVGPFGNFANSFLDLVFTAMFGMVGKSIASWEDGRTADSRQHWMQFSSFAP